MRRFQIYGLGSHRLVGDCFWNIDCTENADLLLGAEDSGKGEPGPLTCVWGDQVTRGQLYVQVCTGSNVSLTHSEVAWATYGHIILTV